ncbi:class I SAM-dependent methyltransferase [Oceanospirillum sp. HFRX-1_2]
MAWPEALQLGLIVLALVAVLSILIGSLRAGISPMPSSRKAHQAVLSMLEMSESVKDSHNRRGLTLIDCGSGWGHLVFQLARRYPEAQVIGYELSFIPWLVSRLLARFLLLNNLTIYRENFLGTGLPVPLSQGNIIFTYLYPKGMTELSKSFQTRPKKQSEPLARSQQLISICFALPGFEAEERKMLNDLYQTRIYRYRL